MYTTDMQRVSKETLTFLRALAKHNNRTWFLAHKDEYKKLHAEFAAFGQELADAVAAFDPRVKAKRSRRKTVKIFRIYRDIRFVKDGPPYKINFGVVISPGGMDSGNPGYYLHIQPGGASFIGGGMHWVMPEQLKRLRGAIDRDAGSLRRIIGSKKFSAVYTEGLADYNALKTVPRGYEKSHPDADLLRLKAFTVFAELKDTEVMRKDFLVTAAGMMKTMKPLNDYLNKIANGR